MSVYPNLIAEYEASGYHISTLADHANVTTELMERIMSGAEAATDDEWRALERLFHRGASYLRKHEAVYINPKTEQGLECRDQFISLMREANAQGAAVWCGPRRIGKLKRAKTIADLFAADKPIPHALYYNVMEDVRSVLNIAKRPPKRGLPIKQAQMVALPEGKGMKKMNGLQVTTHGTLESREVAEMVGKRHADLLRDIETYIGYMEEGGERKIASSDFFIKSYYQSEQNKTLACYLLTKKGCEMVANKLTGAKGVQFTALYVQRFNEMEQGQAVSAVDASMLSPELRMFKHIFDAVAQNQIKQAEVEKQLSETASKVDAVENALSIVRDTIIQRDDDWRKSLNTMFNNAVAASDTKEYQAIRRETYDILEERAHCNLDTRLRNMRDRLSKQGATKTKVGGLTKIDVIEHDPRLKEIYTSVIKEFAIRYTS